MAMDDQWCVACEERIKAATVQVNGKRYDVCSSCKNMIVEDPIYDRNTKEKGAN